MAKKQFKISYHKGTGQACLVVSGKRIYLGKWANWPGEPPHEVVENFNRQVGAVANSTSKAAPRACGQLILSELAANWLEWAAKRYKSPHTAVNLRLDILPLLDMFGSEIVETVGPRRLAEYQLRLAARGRTRQGIMKATARCRQMFAWGVSMEMVSSSHLVALKAMQPLRHGAINAPESKSKEAVDPETVASTLPHLRPTVADMVRLQALTVMRPMEVCGITWEEIKKVSPTEWTWEPANHKMAHLGRRRVVPLGIEAITILVRQGTASGPVFSPMECVREWREEKRRNRKTKVQPSQLDRSKDDPERGPGDQYTTTSYRRAIERAGVKAGVGKWSPNSLRKMAAQMVFDTMGLDAARALLGHADGKITRRHYAKQDLITARKATSALVEIFVSKVDASGA